MKKLSFFIWIIITLTAVACTAEDQNKLTEPIVTASADEITAFSAVLSGYSNDPLSSGIVFGIIYSPSPNPTAETGTKIQAKDMDSQNRFSITVSNLKSNTLYYYRAYQYYKTSTGSGTYRLGEVKSFKTASYSLKVKTNEPSRVLETMAILQGEYLLESVSDPWAEVRFFLAKGIQSADRLKQTGDWYSPDYNQDGLFYTRVYNLQPDTEYSYVAVVFLPDSETMGEVQTFKTSTLNVSFSLTEPIHTTTHTASVSIQVSLDAKSLKYPSYDPYIQSVTLLYGTNKNLTATATATMVNQDIWIAELQNLREGTTYDFGIRVLIYYKNQHYTVYYTSPESEIKHFSTPTEKESRYVDLGLSVPWMEYNLGSTDDNPYGKSFAWGETESRTSFAWSNYKWNQRENGENHITKYNQTDGKMVLMLQDDAAHVTLGEGARIPTKQEWEELRKGCSWAWTTNDGAKGYLVTSKSNGNSIFLPAAGYISPMSSPSVTQQDVQGHYWSSSLDETNIENACCLYFITLSSFLRYYGYSIRPVWDASLLSSFDVDF